MTMMTKYHRFRAVCLSEERERAAGELRDVLKEIRGVDEVTPKVHPLRRYVDVLVEKVSDFTEYFSNIYF